VRHWLKANGYNEFRKPAKAGFSKNLAVGFYPMALKKMSLLNSTLDYPQTWN
jgi:hypothetical protein